MLTEIRRLQHALGMSEGEILRLAREITQDGALISIGRLKRSHRIELFHFMTALVACQLEPAHFAYSE